jgi:hypothetical protein
MNLLEGPVVTTAASAETARLNNNEFCSVYLENSLSVYTSKAPMEQKPDLHNLTCKQRR